MTDLDPITEQILQEIKVTNTTQVTDRTKIKRAAGQLASVEARKRNDPLYQKMVHFRDLYFKYRAAVHQKYGPKVKAKAAR